MKILITGRDGQVGYELERSLQPLGTVISLGRKQMDLSNLGQIQSVIHQIRPSLIVNPAAYTAVDKAESEPDLAMLINGIVPGVIAKEAAKIGAALIHYSTDYVFDGTKEEAYNEQDIPNPLNVYGKTKLAGEQAIRNVTDNYLIFRTSWVYGNRGKNFLQTMLRFARDGNEMRIVNDQFGAPTWCRTIADATAHVIRKQLISEKDRVDFTDLTGIYNLTAQGATTWFGFANAILESFQLDRPHIVPIKTEQYPTPALRPKNSRLSGELFMKTFCNLPEWRSSLSLVSRD